MITDGGGGAKQWMEDEEGRNVLCWLLLLTFFFRQWRVGKKKGVQKEEKCTRRWGRRWVKVRVCRREREERKKSAIKGFNLRDPFFPPQADWNFFLPEWIRWFLWQENWGGEAGRQRWDRREKGSGIDGEERKGKRTRSRRANDTTSAGNNGGKKKTRRKEGKEERKARERERGKNARAPVRVGGEGQNLYWSKYRGENRSLEARLPCHMEEHGEHGEHPVAWTGTETGLFESSDSVL